MRGVEALESVGIRRAESRDRAALAAVLASCGFDAGDRATELPGLLESEAHFVYLAEDESPFGFVAAGRHEGGLLEPTAGEILGLYLATSHQGFGMGRKLLVRGLSVLKRRGFESAFAWLPADSERAITVFEEVSFERSPGLVREINVAGTARTEYGYRIGLEAFF